MGTMLLPEGLGGRGFLFAFSQLIRGLPGPTPAALGGLRLSGTADACGVSGFCPGNLSPLQPLIPGRMAAGSRLGQQQGPASMASLYFSSLKNFICVY